MIRWWKAVPCWAVPGIWNNSCLSVFAQQFAFGDFTNLPLFAAHQLIHGILITSSTTPIAFCHAKACLVSSTPHTCCASFSWHGTEPPLCVTPPSTHSRPSPLEELCLPSPPGFRVGIWFNSPLSNTQRVWTSWNQGHKTRWLYHWRTLCFAAFLLPPRPPFFKTESKTHSAGMKLPKSLFFFFLWLKLLVKEDT